MTIFGYFIMFLVGIIGVYIGRQVAVRHMLKKNTQAYDSATTAVEKRKREAKDKILTLFNKQERIKNNDVERLVGVSDATATRYLQELEDEGSIIQRGKTSGTYYERT